MKFDYVIVGAGIMGLSMAYALREKFPKASILVVEKEKDTPLHASGRNSGVLHAGFYYSSNSLKAKFTKNGCFFWREFCEKHNLPINKCGKVVVVQEERELEGLEELYRRGIKNRVELKIVDEKELKEIEPNAKTIEKAMYSPNTATVDPKTIVRKLLQILKESEVEFVFGKGYISREQNAIKLSTGEIVEYGKLINCAGLYADKIAKDYGLGERYVILPFKGLYLKYLGRDKPVKVNIYPVPDLKFPFLGVHFTVAVDHTIKIGPTAIPVLGRENYEGFSGINFKELATIMSYNAKLFLKSPIFRNLAFEELKKYSKSYFISKAKKLVKHIDVSKFNEWTSPGIRAQLLDGEKLELVQDFIVESDLESVHILNAVSPAFTASIPFARYVVEKYINGGYRNEGN